MTVDPELHTDRVVVFAVGSGGAVVSAVEDHCVAQFGPAGSWEQRHQEFFDLGGVHLGFIDQS